MVEIVTSMRPIGVSEKFLETTEMFLKEKNRRYFGLAGASLQNQLDDPKYSNMGVKIDSKLVSLGIQGEKKTSQILREWIADKPNAILIDSISLPINNLEPEEDDEGQLDLGDTDHVLILGSTIIIIDSKNWKAKASYAINEEHAILRSKKHFKGNRPRIQQAKYLWEKYYEDIDLNSVETYVCISADEKTFIERGKTWWQVGYKLVNQATLIYFLDKFYNERLSDEDKEVIKVEIVAKALMGLVKPYNKYKEKYGNVYNIAVGR